MAAIFDKIQKGGFTKLLYTVTSHKILKSGENCFRATLHGFTGDKLLIRYVFDGNLSKPGLRTTMISMLRKP